MSINLFASPKQGRNNTVSELADFFDLGGEMFKAILRLMICFLAVITLVWSSPALAEGNTANGEAIFKANCAACHVGGKNLVNPTKTLKKEDLEKYGMNSFDAIKNQIIKGKAAMPSFLGKLDDQQIEDVAAYVLAQAEKGW